MRRILIRFALPMLTICRGAYCSAFFLFAPCGLYVVTTAFLRMARTHSFNLVDIFTWTLMGIYSIVLSIAWWMIFTDKPASKQWAIAANLIIVNPYLPGVIIGWRWQVWKGIFNSERDWWPASVIGVVGIIIFSLPYHKWRTELRKQSEHQSVTTVPVAPQAPQED